MDSTNRLKVEAVTTTDAAETADEGIAFCVDGILTGITGPSEKTVLILINNSGVIELGRLIISVQATIPLAQNSSAIVRLYHGNATATVGPGSIKIPINSNSGSLNVANVTVLTNGPTVTGTDFEIAQFYFLLNDTLLIDLIGTIVLAQGGSFRVTCASGGVAGPLGNCAVSLQFFQELP